jgi:hypothetical protein
MTPKQTQLYWREWSAAKKAGALTDQDRYALMEEALGLDDVSSKNLTNEQLDKVLAAFRAISRPSSLNTQLRQIEQPRTRLLHRIAQQLQLLALFVDHPCNYAKTILQDRFNTTFLEELSADPGSGRTGASPVVEGAPPETSDSELAMMRNTLARCLSKLRRRGILSEHGHARAKLWGYHRTQGTAEHPLKLTEHDICQMADVICRCAECARKNRNAVPAISPGLAASAYPGSQPNKDLDPVGVAEAEEPF